MLSRKKGTPGKRGRAGARQLELDWKTWGGPSKGAGRPRIVRSRVPHRQREALSSREPLHLTTKLRAGLPSLRRRRETRTVLGVFRERCESAGFRLVHFSVQSNHLHLIVEAQNRAELSRGMRRLLVSLARRLNRLWARGGQVFRRFHEHVLRTPREVRHAVRYVLGNSRKHGHVRPAGKPDPHSSALPVDVAPREQVRL